MADRADVMAAIQAKVEGMTFASAVNGVTTWKSVSRKLRMWDQTPDQPAAFLVTHRELDEYRGLGLLRRRLELAVWCYTRTDNSIGQDDIDVIMKSFEKAFGQAAVDDPSTNQCTLGGLVYWVRIEGRVLKDPGDLDNQALLIVPLVVEMP